MVFESKFINPKSDSLKLKLDIFEENKNTNLNNYIDLFITVDQKLVNFDFKKYSIKSYKKLDDLSKSKILDYSLEMSWKNKTL